MGENSAINFLILFKKGIKKTLLCSLKCLKSKTFAKANKERKFNFTSLKKKLKKILPLLFSWVLITKVLRDKMKKT